MKTSTSIAATPSPRRERGSLSAATARRPWAMSLLLLAADVATTSERILDAPQRDYSSRVDRTRRGSAVQSAAP